MTITDPAHLEAAAKLRKMFQQPRAVASGGDDLARDLTDYDRASGWSATGCMPVPTASPAWRFCWERWGALGWRQADPIIGLAITVANPVLSAQPSARSALDSWSCQRGLGRASHRGRQECPGISDVRELYVDAHLSVVEAHQIAHHAERHLLRHVRRLTAATVHSSLAGTHSSYQAAELA